MGWHTGRMGRRAEVDRLTAEVDRLTRERDEALRALEPLRGRLRVVEAEAAELRDRLRDRDAVQDGTEPAAVGAIERTWRNAGCTARCRWRNSPLGCRQHGTFVGA